MQHNEPLNSNPEHERRFLIDPRRILLVSAVLVFTFVWVVQSVLTRNIWLNNLIRPYLPDWALLTIGLSAPITLAVVGSRAVPWKISMFFSFILSLQAALLGLVGEKYRLLQGAVTALAYLEAYFLLPQWNRRIEDRNMPRHGTVLHLK